MGGMIHEGDVSWAVSETDALLGTSATRNVEIERSDMANTYPIYIYIYIYKWR